MVPHPPNALNNPGRLAALKSLGLMDSPREPGFDRLAKLAKKLLQAPVCLVSFVDDHRQFFKAGEGQEGPAAEARQTPLSHSFCQHVVTSGEALIVDDARENALLRDNLAICDLGVIAYLGIPIQAPGGQVLGSFCVIDSKRRAWQPREIDLMRELTQLVMTEVALRHETLERQRTVKDLREREAQLTALVENSPLAAVLLDRDFRCAAANAAWHREFGLEPGTLLGQKHAGLVPGAPASWEKDCQDCQAENRPISGQGIYTSPTTATVPVQYELRPWHDSGGAVGGVLAFVHRAT